MIIIIIKKILSDKSVAKMASTVYENKMCVGEGLKKRLIYYLILNQSINPF